IDVTTGNITPWTPNVVGAAFPSVNALALSGNTIYIGGRFTSVGGQPRSNLAAIDITTGAAVATWHPSADNGVKNLAVSGTTIYAGGWFTKISGQPRNHLAAFDASTGAVTPWNPNVTAIGQYYAPQVNTLVISG